MPDTTTAVEAPAALAVPADLELARSALRAAVDRTCSLLQASDPARAVPHLRWTVGEVGAHLVIALRAYGDSAAGSVASWTDAMPAVESYQERMAEVTNSTLTTEPERDPAVLTSLLREALDRFLQASAPMTAATMMATPWYAPDATLPLSAATCLLLGEQLIHGHDIATAMGAPWRIGRDDALLAVHAIAFMLPVVVRPDAIRGLTEAQAVHLRGGPTFTLALDGGRVRVTPGTSGPVACHLSADPATFMMVAYGRMSQWRGIGRGRLLAWGRRPWRALRLRSYFYNP